jgi:uncharacterized damage-inducible protein DinB
MPTVAANFTAFSVTQLRAAEKQIAACVQQFTEAQLWHRTGDYENSIANLLLHLEGNMRQWILHGVAGHPDVRLRDAEFALTPTMTAAAAHTLFTRTLDEVCTAISQVTPEHLLLETDPQPRPGTPPCTRLDAIYRVVCHIHHHAGQVILLTKQHTARDLDLSMPRKR